MGTTKRTSLNDGLMAVDDNGNDISLFVIDSFSNNQKAIRQIMNHSDFDFLYNGVFQHNDDEFRDRYIEEKEIGMLIVTQYKCALLAWAIRDLLLHDTLFFDTFIEQNKQLLLRRKENKT